MLLVGSWEKGKGLVYFESGLVEGFVLFQDSITVLEVGDFEHGDAVDGDGGGHFCGGVDCLSVS